MLFQKELFKALPAIFAAVEHGRLQRAVCEVKRIVISLKRGGYACSPCRVLTPRQVSSVNAKFIRLLCQLRSLWDSCIDIPAVALAFANWRPQLTINIRGGKPRSPARLIHINAVVEVGQLISALMFAVC